MTDPSSGLDIPLFTDTAYAMSLMGLAYAYAAAAESNPPNTGTDQQNDRPLDDYAQAQFAHPTLQRTSEHLYRCA